MGLLEWECTVCLCPIKSLRKLIVSYLLRTHNEYERLNNEIKHMYNETIQPPEANGILFLLGAEFARGRVCQGPRCPGIIRHSQRLCKFVSRIITQRLFLFFLLLPVLKRPEFLAILEPIMDIFFQILDKNWLDDT